VRLILASASPRRAELLAAAGYAFQVHAVNVDERPRGGESPSDYVARLAADKAAKALDELAGRRDGVSDDLMVLGADTAVVVGGEILGKPRDVQDGERMLRELSGRTHEVLTGVAIRSRASGTGAVARTLVQFAPLDAQDVAWYVASGEGRDKAGGYAIQGLAARFIPRIEGSYSNVVGLPIETVHRLLQELGRGTAVLASRGE
jgi:septum formation protein